MPSGMVSIPGYQGYDALVAPSGGKYTNISDACVGESTDATIMVAPGVYIETANIVPRSGQTILAAGGVNNFGGVIVQMGDFIVDLTQDYTTIRSIKFEFTPVTDQAFFISSGDYVLVEDCICDFSGAIATTHHGFEIYSRESIFRDITVIGSLLTESPVYTDTCFNNVFENIKTVGGIITVAHPNLFTAYDNRNCKWDNITIGVPFASTGGTSFYVLVDDGNAQPSFYSNIRMTGGGADSAIVYDDDGMGPMVSCDEWVNLKILGYLYGVTIFYVNGVQMTNVSIGENGYYTQNAILLSGAQNFKLANAEIHCSVTGISNSASDLSGFCSFVNVHFDLIGGTELVTMQGGSWCWYFSNCQSYNGNLNFIGASSQAFLSNCSFSTLIIDSFYLIQISNCAFDGIDIGATTETVYALLSNVSVGTSVVNGDYSIALRIASSYIAAFTDSGSDTVIDVYRIQQVTADDDIRGSTIYSNRDAAGEVVLTLPDPAGSQVSEGFRFRVLVQSDNNVKIEQSALQYIRIGNSTTTPGAGCGIQNAASGAAVEIIYMGGDEWMVITGSPGSDWSIYSPS